jgi:hypothetical protein
MGRKKIDRFTKSKMIASRVEETDYWKFELLLKKEHKSLQDVINSFVVSYISGNLVFSGSELVSKTGA